MNESTRLPVYVFEGFRLDTQRRVLFGIDSQPVAVTPRLFDALLYFVEHAGQLLTKEQLLEAIWPNVVVEEHNLNKTVSELRRVLGEKPGEHKFFVTKPGHGYRFVADVTRAPRPEISVPELARSGPTVAPTAAAQRRIPWPALATTAVIGVAALAALAPWNRRDDSPRLTVAGAVGNLTFEPRDETEPSLSPDGSRVAFLRDLGGGRVGVHVTEIGSTRSLPLTPAGRGVERSPRWSPVRPEIAFLRQQGPTAFDLMIVSAFGEEERRLTTLHVPVLVVMGGSPMIAWTPDGRLVFGTLDDPTAAVLESSMYVLSPETGAIAPFGEMAGGVNAFDTPLAISPDGRHLAFGRFERNERRPRLMTQELGAGLEPQGAPQYVPGIPAVQTGASPVWSPDGETLTFLVGREIWEWTVGGTARGVYSTPLLPQGLDMSWRDGRARAVIALSVANLDIWALPVDPRSHTAVGAAVVRIDSTAAERAQSFSPDGRKLAFTSAISGTGQVWLANADGSERRQLTHLPQPVMSSTQWSPDGHQIAFPVVDPAGGDLITNVIDVEGGLPRPLFKGYVNDWSADGQYLYAFRLGAPEMTWRARVADGTLEELFHGGGTVETVDGVELLYSKNNHFGIFARALAGNVAANPERKLLDDYYPARGDIVPVEDGFYYVRHTENGDPRAFGFYDYATQRAHDVAPAPKSVDIGMTISPDGTELLYSAWGPGSDFDLKMVEFDAR